ncbi:MAG: M23 family metallopeptidase [Elusimicrobiota bacterium]
MLFSFNFKKTIFLLLSLFLLIILTAIYLIKKEKISTIIEDKKFNYLEGNFATTLEKELIRKNVQRSDINGIIKAYSGNLDFKKLGEKDDYLITLSSSGNFISMIIDKGETSYSVFKSTDGFFSFQKSENTVRLTTYSVEGEIKSVLWNSMVAKKIPSDIILNFADIFAWQIDFLTEVRDGDRFKVVYYVKENLKGKVIERKVIGGVYDGVETGKNIMIYFKGEYYNEKGEGAKSMFLKAPLQYRRISSYFTYKRFHPVLRYVRPHLGIDYAAPTGTPVSAVADGVVVYKGWNGGYGNFIEIKHSMGYSTSYGHLSRYAKNIYVGKKVKQGEVIGYVGATGLATGPHLDFRIKQGNTFINYLKMKRRTNVNLDKKYLPDLEKAIKDLGLI